MTTFDSALVPEHLQIITEAVHFFSRHRCDAVIVIGTEFDAVKTGTALDAHLSVPLLGAVFAPDSLNPFRKGAVLISGNKVLRAGVPLVRDPDVDWRILLARELRGLVVHVSADDGEVRFADGNTAIVVQDVDGLAWRLVRT